MESVQEISFNHKGYEYLIIKTISEYIIDEPCGGGKSINYRIENGIPLKFFKHFIDDKYISLNFLEKIEKTTGKDELLLIEYDFNYIWELGFKDNIIIVTLKDFENKIIKFSFSQLENSFRRLVAKL